MSKKEQYTYGEPQEVLIKAEIRNANEDSNHYEWRLPEDQTDDAKNVMISYGNKNYNAGYKAGVRAAVYGVAAVGALVYGVVGFIRKRKALKQEKNDTEKSDA